MDAGERFAALRRDAGDGVEIGEGSYADYVALSRHHYAAGSPATCVRVLRASDAGRVVGVLVVSMPTLNGGWRARAWPREAAGLSRSESAAWVNANLRTISRVIVEPRWRGCGVARRLVRAYLDDPLTARTEAVAAMAHLCPFFEAAGMRRVTRGRPRADAALARALRRAGIKAWELLDLSRGRRAWRERRELREALRRWAGQGRGTRGLLTGPPEILGARAGSRLTARGAVLVYP